MALETLAGIKTIDGFDVKRVEWPQTEDNYIEISEGSNSITFQIQNGPIGDNGVNGCQVNTLIETARLIVHGLNKKFPCRENSLVVTRLEEALHWLAHRKANREARGVEGKNEE